MPENLLRFARSQDVLTLAGRMIQFSTQLVMVLLLPKALAPKVYAQLNLLLPLAFLGSTLVFGWLTGSINRYVFDLLNVDDSRARETAFIFYGGVSVILIAAFLLISVFTDSAYKLIPLLLVAAGLKEVVVGVLNMSGNHKGFFYANCGFAVSLAIFIGLCLRTEQDDLPLFLTIYGSIDVVLAILAWHLTGIAIVKSWPRFNNEVASKYFRYGIPLVAKGLPVWIMSVSDRYLLAAIWASKRDLAGYILSYQLAGSVITIPLSFMVTVFLPKILRIDRDKGEAAALLYTHELLRYYLRYIPLVIIVACSFVLAIAYTIYSEYRLSALVIIIIVVAHAIQGLVHFYNKEFELNGQTMILTRSVSIGAVVNVGLNLLLMPQMGPLGAAVSTLMAYVASVAVVYRARQFRPGDSAVNIQNLAGFDEKSSHGDDGADANKVKTVVDASSKSTLRRYHELTIYWMSIGWDALRPGRNQSVYVLGYIKSGTNWLCHLLSSALGLPILEPWKRNLPKLGSCVFHMHRFVPLNSVRRRTIYLVRDARDAIVSAYFHAVREGGEFRKEVENYLGRPITTDNIRDNLPGFIRFMQINHTASTDYRNHVEIWRRHRTQYVLVRYEDMLSDVEGQLSRAIEKVTGMRPDSDRIRQAVSQHDFEKVTKRTKGVADNNSFMRKGISGDWKNYFSAEAAQVMDTYAGDLLIELGYETDHNWVKDQ